MANTVCDLHATELLKFKTFVLKVLIHCEGCKKKVKKVVQSIEGVYKTEIDPLQHKVVVTGSIDAETVINQLLKKGKQAQIWPQSINNNNNNNNNIDNKSETTNQEEKKPASSSRKSKKNEETKQENPPINEADKKIPAEKMGEEYKTTSPQTNHAHEAPIENKSPANNLQLVRPTETSGAQVTALDGSSREAKKKPNKRAENIGEGNNSCEAEKKLIKKAENGEGLINNAPPPLKMADHFPPPSSNAIAPPDDLIIQAAYQPMIPAEEYREVMSYNNTSSYSTSTGDPAFYAPQQIHHSYAYFGPSTNGYYPPPPPDPIRAPFSDHNDYYSDYEDESGCSIM